MGKAGGSANNRLNTRDMKDQVDATQFGRQFELDGCRTNDFDYRKGTDKTRGQLTRLILKV